MRLHALIWSVGLLLLAGCGGGGSPAPPQALTVVLSTPVGLSAGVNASWTATLAHGTAPYRVTWNFGGGALPAQVAQAGQGAVASVSVEPQAGSWTLTVNVTDAAGATAKTSARYSVAPAPDLHVSAAYAAGSITLATNRPDGGLLQISAECPPGLSLGAISQPLVNGNSGAVVPLTVLDPLQGANGDVSLRVVEAGGAAGTTSVHIDVPPVVLAADTLYAYPLQRVVHVGEPVTVVVATGPTATPFANAQVGLLTPADAHGAALTPDMGLPDDDPNPHAPLDGIWSDTGATAFFDDSDFLVPVPVNAGQLRWSWYSGAAGGHPVTLASGAVLSFKLWFSEPGVKTFGFHSTDGLHPQTWYEDEAGNQHTWTSLSNAGGGALANAVLVLPPPLAAPQLSASLTVDRLNLVAGVPVIWLLNAYGGTAPYAVSWDFDGAGVEPVSGQDAPGRPNSFRASVLLPAGAGTARATVTDAAGASYTAECSYSVQPQHGVHATARYEDGQLLVGTDVPAPAGLTCRVNPDALFMLGPSERFIREDGMTGFRIECRGKDLFAPTAGNLHFSFSDSSALWQGSLNLPLNLPGFQLAPDTLYAIPLRRQVRVGEDVTVVIATGPTAQPFRYFPACALTLPADGRMMTAKLDVGDPDSLSLPNHPIDGIWAQVQPTAFAMPDEPFNLHQVDDQTLALDLYLSPLNGHEVVGARGAICNLPLAFSTPGLKVLGFEGQRQGQAVTAYAGDDGNEVSWSNVLNDSSGGIPNTIEVVAE